MDSRIIKIPLSKDRYIALSMLMHKHLIIMPEVAEAHPRLMGEHMLELYWVMLNKIRIGTDKKKYTLKLSRPQALAFAQYWGDAYTTNDIYTDLIIHECIATIDQEFKRPATIPI